MDFYKKMFENNADWVAKRVEDNAQYFDKLSKGQTPQLLYVGCADSRIPPNELLGLGPGEMFVHRNIANVVVHTDMNFLSVLDYAVNVLQVQHIVLAGHYECGGVKASMSNKQYGLIDNWLGHLKDVYRVHYKELDGIVDEKLRFDRFVELNIKEQVYNICKTTIVQNAWGKGQVLHVHGCVIDIRTGFIKDLGFTTTNNDNLPAIFQFGE